MRRGNAFCLRSAAWLVAAAVTVVATFPAWGAAAKMLPSATSSRAELTSVSCPSRTVCMAVGSVIHHSGDITLAERWNGTVWRLERTPNPSGVVASRLFGVACPTTSMCIAVGDDYAYATGVTLPVAELWWGGSWRLMHTPDIVYGSLHAIACASVDACTAVGYAQSSTGWITLAERWDGSRWHVQPSPTPSDVIDPSDGDLLLTGVACPTPRNCTAVGYYDSQSATTEPLLLRWNGLSWRLSAVASPPDSSPYLLQLDAVACPMVDDCRVVGSDQHGVLVERWDGTTWHVEPAPNPLGGGAALGVACSSQSACTAVGRRLTAGPGGEGTLAERWDGSFWRLQRMPHLRDNALLLAVACPARHQCMAVGSHLDQGDLFTAPLAERWNGSGWAVLSTPS